LSPLIGSGWRFPNSRNNLNRFGKSSYQDHVEEKPVMTFGRWSRLLPGRDTN
jgi:hypothetical protein